jgi:transposase
MSKVNQKVDYTGQTVYVGIDVHLKSWNISVYYNGQYLTSFNQPPTTQALVSYLQESYPNAHYKCAYESGFCGYWIQRALIQLGVACIVVNAADVPQTDKTLKNKTDTNDSKRLAQALQAGLLQAIYIPDEEIEADRQLVRCNERFNNDLIRAKNRIKGLLYQMGIKLPDNFANSNWSNLFIQWLKALELKSLSAKITLLHQVKMVEFIREEKLAVLKNIRALLKKERYAATAYHLMSVPGIGPITAASLLTEIDNMKRFSNFEQLNSFIGFYPSQFSSGENIHQGNIIGRQHKRLRSLLIESAWTSVRTDPAMTKVYSELKIKVGSKRAIVKVARKLLSRIRYVWLNQTQYEKGIIQ